MEHLYHLLSMRIVDLTMQLLEQLTEMKQTASKLTNEQFEMVNLRQRVISLEQQNIREAELIQQVKDQVKFSEEVIRTNKLLSALAHFSFLHDMGYSVHLVQNHDSAC